MPERDDPVPVGSLIGRRKERPPYFCRWLLRKKYRSSTMLCAAV